MTSDKPPTSSSRAHNPPTRKRLRRTLAARRLRRFITLLGFDRHWYLVLVAAVIGVVMGAVATAFIMPLRWAEGWSEEADPALLKWVVPVAPVAGALLAGTVIYLFGRTVKGPGVSAVMYAIHRSKSRLPLRIAIRKWIAATSTIATGGSAGAEGPIVTIGATIGSNVGKWLRTNPQDTATLLGCGAAAGISSVFNAPIAGIFFVLEILLRDFSLRTFTPIVIASVMSAACTQAILGGDDALFPVAGKLFMEDAVFAPTEIPNYLILGVICGLAAAMFIKALYATMDLFGKLRLHPILKPVVGAMLLGLLGLAYLWLVPGHHIPVFYGNGYPVIEELLGRDHYLDPATGALYPVMGLLLFLAATAVLKPLATCLTIGSGGAGGFFAPSLLLGAALGGAFGTIAKQWGWIEPANPAHYAVVGMAATVAAVLNAPLTAILIVYEITRSYEIILPLMLAAVISTVVARLISRQSVYTVQLKRLGVQVGEMSDLTILSRLSVKEVLLVPPVFVHPDDSAQRLLELSEQHTVSDFVVVDDRDHYVGMVTGTDLQAALIYRESIPLLQVSELQRSDLPVVMPDESLDLVLEKFSRHDVHSLAVLDQSGGEVRGLITRARLMGKYQSVLSKD